MEADGDHPRMMIVDLGGGAALNVFEVPRDDHRRAPAPRRPGAIDHFGIAVPDRAALEQGGGPTRAAGAEIGEIQNLGGDTWSPFFRDVDGMELEVCAP